MPPKTFAFSRSICLSTCLERSSSSISHCWLMRSRSSAFSFRSAAISAPSSARMAATSSVRSRRACVSASTSAVFCVIRKVNTALVEALTQARRERTEEVAAIRAEDGAEIAALRKENAELRERISQQWEMEDELRSRHVDKQMDLEKAKVFGGIVGALGQAGVAQFFPKGSAGHQNVRQQRAEKFLDSFTKEQADTILPLLNQEQQTVLASFLRLGV